VTISFVEKVTIEVRVGSLHSAIKLFADQLGFTLGTPSTLGEACVIDAYGKLFYLTEPQEDNSQDSSRRITSLSIGVIDPRKLIEEIVAWCHDIKTPVTQITSEEDTWIIYLHKILVAPLKITRYKFSVYLAEDEGDAQIALSENKEIILVPAGNSGESTTVYFSDSKIADFFTEHLTAVPIDDLMGVPSLFAQGRNFADVVCELFHVASIVVS
jgi:hypothetical protein